MQMSADLKQLKEIGIYRENMQVTSKPITPYESNVRCIQSCDAAEGNVCCSLL